MSSKLLVWVARGRYFTKFLPILTHCFQWLTCLRIERLIRVVKSLVTYRYGKLIEVAGIDLASIFVVRSCFASFIAFRPLTDFYVLCMLRSFDNNAFEPIIHPWSLICRQKFVILTKHLYTSKTMHFILLVHLTRVQIFCWSFSKVNYAWIIYGHVAHVMKFAFCLLSL